MKTTKLLTAFLAVSLISLLKIYYLCPNRPLPSKTNDSSRVFSSVNYKTEAENYSLLSVCTSLIQILFHCKDKNLATPLISVSCFSTFAHFMANSLLFFKSNDKSLTLTKISLLFNNYRFSNIRYREQTIAASVADKENSRIYSIESRFIKVDVQKYLHPYVVYHDPTSFIRHSSKSDSKNILFSNDNSGSFVEISNTSVIATSDTSKSFYAANYDQTQKCLSHRSKLLVLNYTPPSKPFPADTFCCGAPLTTLVPENDAHITDYRWFHDSFFRPLFSLAIV